MCKAGLVGVGNINVNPIFLSTTNLMIVPGSRCIDAGNPVAAYNDTCFPPSLGTARNDIGAHGGPGACGWTVPPWPVIVTPPTNQTVFAGNPATFSVTAAGSALTYQWKFNGTPISGKTDASF